MSPLKTRNLKWPRQQVGEDGTQQAEGMQLLAGGLATTLRMGGGLKRSLLQHGLCAAAVPVGLAGDILDPHLHWSASAAAGPRQLL